jgi:hypothetical protein
MSMLTRHSLDHIANDSARAAIRVIRDKTTGFRKVYGSRYLEALGRVCKSTVQATAEGTVVVLANGTTKLFPTAKSAGLYMEFTINDWYTLGVL